MSVIIFVFQIFHILIFENDANKPIFFKIIKNIRFSLIQKVFHTKCNNFAKFINVNHSYCFCAYCAIYCMDCNFFSSTCEAWRRYYFSFQLIKPNDIWRKAHSPATVYSLVWYIEMLVTGFVALHVYSPSFSLAARKVMTEPFFRAADDWLKNQWKSQSGRESAEQVRDT